VESPRPLRIFFAYRDAPERRAALAQPTGSPERYRLFGLDELVARGATVRHSLERGSRPPLWARALGAAMSRALYRLGGYSGDFASALWSLRAANSADVVFSTVDTVGIPLILLKRFGLVRSPIVYTAIGLPERLVQLRGRPMQRLYARALRETQAIVSYAESETVWLRDWLGADGPSVHFVPFGVDVTAFRPVDGREPVMDVVSVGADPRRDFLLLLTVASRRPELSFRIVASAEHARLLGPLPENVALETDLSLAQVRERLAEARVVALPVRENSYSGATTTLLQAMAMAKAVIVSRTDAIAYGYELQDGHNCRLVEPGDAEAFERALLETLTGANAGSLGTRARETVERSLSWERYADALFELLSARRSP
jgi:glycosyltransferase involved in cell wall biosynthesis